MTLTLPRAHAGDGHLSRAVTGAATRAYVRESVQLLAAAALLRPASCGTPALNNALDLRISPPGASLARCAYIMPGAGVARRGGAVAAVDELVARRPARARDGDAADHGDGMTPGCQWQTATSASPERTDTMFAAPNGRHRLARGTRAGAHRRHPPDGPDRRSRRADGPAPEDADRARGGSLPASRGTSRLRRPRTAGRRRARSSSRRGTASSPKRCCCLGTARARSCCSTTARSVPTNRLRKPVSISARQRFFWRRCQRRHREHQLRATTRGTIVGEEDVDGEPTHRLELKARRAT